MDLQALLLNALFIFSLRTSFCMSEAKFMIAKKDKKLITENQITIHAISEVLCFGHCIADPKKLCHSVNIHPLKELCVLNYGLSNAAEEMIDANMKDEYGWNYYQRSTEEKPKKFYFERTEEHQVKSKVLARIPHQTKSWLLSFDFKLNSKQYSNHQNVISLGSEIDESNKYGGRNPSIYIPPAQARVEIYMSISAESRKFIGGYDVNMGIWYTVNITQSYNNKASREKNTNVYRYEAKLNNYIIGEGDNEQAYDFYNQTLSTGLTFENGQPDKYLVANGTIRNLIYRNMPHDTGDVSTTE